MNLVNKFHALNFENVNTLLTSQICDLKGGTEEGGEGVVIFKRRRHFHRWWHWIKYHMVTQ